MLYSTSVRDFRVWYEEATAGWHRLDATLAPYGLSSAHLLLLLLLVIAYQLARRAYARLKGSVSQAAAERDMLLLRDAPRSDYSSAFPMRVDLAIFELNYAIGAGYTVASL